MEKRIEELKDALKDFESIQFRKGISRNEAYDLIAHIKQLEAENEKLTITIVNNGQDWAALHIEKRELESTLATYKAVVEKALMVNWENALSQLEYIDKEDDADLTTFLQALQAVKEKS